MINSHVRRIFLSAIVVGFVVLAIMATADAYAQPTSWDWRHSLGPNLVSGVRNQGGCGNDYILAPLDMVESREMIFAYRAGSYIPDIDY